MSKITSLNVYECCGPTKPGGIANIIVVATHVKPIDILIKVRGFGRTVAYGPFRDLTNPFIARLQFKIPPIVARNDTTNLLVKVEVYVFEKGGWHLAASRDIKITIIGVKPLRLLNRKKLNNISREPKTKGSILLPLLLLGVALIR